MEHFSAYADSDEEIEKKEEVKSVSLVQYDNDDDEEEKKENDSNSNVQSTPPTNNTQTANPPSPRIETVIDVDIQAPESKPVPVESFVSLLPSDVPSLDDMLPPKPTAQPDPKLTEKLNRFHQLRDQGKSINQNLCSSHAFKNPDILEKLVQYMGVKEIGTNYPKTLFNPLPVDESDYFDNLAKTQNAFYENKPEQAAPPTQAPASAPTTASSNAKSKSKWDVVEEENKRELPPARQEVPKRDVKKGTEEEPNSAYAEYIKKKQAESRSKEGAFNKKPRKS